MHQFLPFSLLIRFVTDTQDLGLVGLMDSDPNCITIVPTAVDSVDEENKHLCVYIGSFQVSMCVSQVSQDRE